ncbi:MAG: type II toxin-antitoxin system RelE/ParE family toxin [Candidatus Kapabacteria bacterium]|nr:type II toxin-antitoxin system RelE/ParE family toxin [Candidatus Kapabacteria bacterium]
MKYIVRVSIGAENDLASIATYIARADSNARASRFVNELTKLISTLERFPRRGVVPKELVTVGSNDIRQLLIWDYRVIYEIFDKTVRVLVVVDGKRDLSSILQKRHLSF